MGGLMITEPAYGSDALNMKTAHRELEDNYRLEGIKHWQGLTGLADYWIIASRGSLPTGELKRDIEFRSEEHTSELQSLMRISSAVFCLQKKTKTHTNIHSLYD